MTLITQFFSPITPEQAAEQATRDSERSRQSTRWLNAQKIIDQSKRVEREKQMNLVRQQRHRLRVKEAEVKQGLRDPQTLRKLKVSGRNTHIEVTSCSGAARL